MKLRRLFRFSLASFVLLILLLGSGMLLCFSWAPWVGVRLQGPRGGQVLWAHFSPDGKRVAVTEKYGKEGVTHLMEADTRRVLFSLDGVDGVGWTLEGRLVNGTTFYDAETGRLLAHLPLPERYERPSLTYSPDASRVVVESCPSGNLTTNQMRYNFRLWTTDSFQMLAEFTSSEGTYPYVLFSPDGHLLVHHYQPRSTGFVKIIEGWNAKTGQRQWTIRREGRCVERVWFGPQGSLLTEEEEIHLEDFYTGPAFTIYWCEWDTKDGNLVRETKVRESNTMGGEFPALTFSVWSRSTAGGRRLEGDWVAHIVRLRDAETNGLLSTFPELRLVSTAAYARLDPEGRRFLYVDHLHEGDAWLFARRRPERWWGVTWLWEFWLTSALAAALAWSLWRDRHPHIPPLDVRPRGE